MRRLVFLIFLFPFLASAQVTGYKIKRTHDGDTLVGYLTENAGTGRTGLVLLNDGDTAMVYSDGTYLVLDPVTGLKIKQLTYGSSQRFLSVIGERVYITDIDSFAGNADSIYVSYCDGCSGTSGLVTNGDTIFVDTSSSVGYWELVSNYIEPTEDRGVMIPEHLFFNDTSVYIVGESEYTGTLFNNGDFESVSYYEIGGVIYASFTNWSGGNIDTVDGYSGDVALQFKNNGNAYSASAPYYASCTSGSLTTVRFYYKGDPAWAPYQPTTANGLDISTGLWNKYLDLSGGNVLPTANDWTLYSYTFTCPSYSYYGIWFNGGVGDAVDYVTNGSVSHRLIIHGDDIRVEDLPDGSSDTAVVIEDGRLYKNIISGSIDTFYLAPGAVQGSGWLVSGDTIYIDTTAAAVNYDSLALYINIDSLVTQTLIDSILSSVNIDSTIVVTVTNYLDTNTTFIDSFYVSYTDTIGVSGWYYSGDTMYIDTSIFNDTVTFSYITVDSITVTTIEIDTILLGTDTIYSFIDLKDSLYFNFTSAPSVSGWVGMNDTVSIDTAAMYIWAVGDAGTQNAKFKNSENYVTGNYGIAIGYQDTMTGSYAFASGWKTVSSGQGSTTIGVLTKATGTGAFAAGYGAQTTTKYYVMASGTPSFNLSAATALDSSNASGASSGIFTGVNNNVSGDYSAVVGGLRNNLSGEGSAIIGMTDKTASGNNTVYVENLDVDGTVTLNDVAHAAGGRPRLVLDAGVVKQDTTTLGGAFTGYWTKAGSALYPNNTTDSVAIGGTSPTEILTVTGNGVVSGDLTANRVVFDGGSPTTGDTVELGRFVINGVSWGSIAGVDYGGGEKAVLISANDTTQLQLIGSNGLYIKPHDASGGILFGDHFSPYNDDEIDLGISGSQYRNGYFDGTVYADGLNLEDLSYTTGKPVLVLDGSTVKLDSTLEATSDTGYFELSGTNLYPKSTSYNLAIGKATASYDLDVNGSAMVGGTMYINNANNKLVYDGTYGLDIHGYPATIDFYIGGSKFAEMNNSLSPPYFKPNGARTTDLGSSGTPWRETYSQTYKINNYGTLSEAIGTPITLLYNSYGVRVSSSSGYVILSADDYVKVEGCDLYGQQNNDIGGNSSSTNFNNLYLNGSAYTGNVIPRANNAYDLGLSYQQWKNGYFDGTVYADALNLDGLSYTTSKPVLVLDGSTVKLDSTTNRSIHWVVDGNNLTTDTVRNFIIPSYAGQNYIESASHLYSTSFIIGAGDTITGNGLGENEATCMIISDASKMDSSSGSYIIGGFMNEINLGYNTNIYGSIESVIDYGLYSSILGGYSDTIHATERSMILSSGYSVINSDAGSDYSNVILGGEGENRIDNSSSSAIISGYNSLINNADRSVVIGGDGITATESNTVYVPRLKVYTSADNYTLIDSNGITLAGTHITYDDLRVAASSAKTTGASNVPDFEKVQDSTGTVGVYTYVFSPTTMEQVFFSVQMPHQYNGGTVYPHVHWTPTDTTTDDTVVWALEYTWANIGSAFGETRTVYGKGVTAGNLVHTLTNLTEIDGSGKSESSMLICRLYRDAANDSDDYADDAAYLEFDLHYPLSQIGGSDHPIPDY